MSPTFTSIGKRLRIRIIQHGSSPPPAPDDPNEVSWASAGSSFQESAGVVGLALTLTQPAEIGAQVPFVALAGSFPAGQRLLRGQDFEFVTDSSGDTLLPEDLLRFPEGSTSLTLWVRIEDDSNVEQLESVIVRLVNSNQDGTRQGLVFGDTRDHLLRVLASDSELQLDWDSSTGDVTEADSNVTYTVNASLSGPAPAGGVTADVTPVSGSANAGTDYTLVTTSLSFAEGETTKPVQVTILGNDTYQGERTLELELRNIVGADGGSAISHILTIEDDEDPPGDTQRVSWDADDAQGFSLQEDGTEFKLRMKLEDNQVAEEDIEVTYEAVGVGSNPATFGVDFTFGSPNPITIRKGRPAVNVKLSANSDGDIEGLETFEMRIVSVSSVYPDVEVGSIDTASGSIIDDTVDTIEAKWSQAAATAVEGSQGVSLGVILDQETDTGLTIPVAIGGSASPSDYEITWPGDQEGEIRIVAGGQGAPITIRALEDTITDDGETITLTLQPGNGYELEDPSVLTINLEELEPGVTLVEYEPVLGLGQTLVQACVPIDPVPEGSLPSFTMDGRQCDVLPVAPGYHDGLIRWVQLVGLADGTGQASVDLGSGQPYGGAYDTVDLGEIEIWASIANRLSSTYKAKFSESTLVEVMDDGVLKRTEWRFMRFRDENESDPRLEYCMGMHMLLTRRPEGVEIWYILANDTYDPNISALASPASHVEVDGPVYLKDIRFVGGAVGYEYHSLNDDQSQDTDSNFFMKAGNSAGEGLSESHIIPAGMTIPHHYLLKPTAMSTSTANEIALGKGHGYAGAGPYNVHARDGFGSQCARVPDMRRDPYAYVSGGTVYRGRDASKKRNEDYLSKVLAKVANFNSQRPGSIGLWDNDGDPYAAAPSYWCPAGKSYPQSGSGIEIIKRHGFDFVREQLSWMRMQLTYTLQRQPTGLTHVDRGDNVRAFDIATVTQGNYPFASNHFLSYEYRWPFKLIPGWGSKPSLHKAPVDLPWNEPQLLSNGSPVSTVEPGAAELFGPDPDGGPGVYSYGEYDNDHYIAIYYAAAAAAWCWNEPLARWHLRREAAHIERQASPYPIVGDVPNGFQRFTFGAQNLLDVMQSAAHPAGHGVPEKWGGVSAISQYNGHLHRGWGHYLDIHAYGSALTPSSAVQERAAQKEWGRKLEEVTDYIATQWGGTARDSAFFRTGQPNDYFALNFPIRDDDWENPLNEGATSWQVYMPCYYGLGVMGQAMTNTGLGNAPGFRRVVVNLALAIWRKESDGGSRKEDQTRAPAYLTTTNGDDSWNDPPASVPVAYKFIPAAGGPNWEPYANTRCAPLMACALKWALQEADSDLYEELLELVRSIAVLEPTASLAEIEEQFLAAMGADDAEDYRQSGGGLADLLGRVQAAMAGDGPGGSEYPTKFDETNTGYTGSLTPYTGTMPLPAGTYENVSFSGTVSFGADDIVLRNFEIDAGGNDYGIENVDFLPSGSPVVRTGIICEDGEIRNAKSSCVIASSGTFRRLNVHDSGGDAFKVKGVVNGDFVLVVDSYLHHIGNVAVNGGDVGGIHADGNQVRRSSGGSITFRRVNHALGNPGSGYAAPNACMIVQAAEAAIDSVILYDECYFSGGNYLAYFTAPSTFPPPSDWELRNCIWANDWAFGPIQYQGTGGLITGNRREDTGENVDDELIAQTGW